MSSTYLNESLVDASTPSINDIHTTHGEHEARIDRCETNRRKAYLLTSALASFILVVINNPSSYISFFSALLIISSNFAFASSSMRRISSIVSPSHMSI